MHPAVLLIGVLWIVITWNGYDLLSVICTPLHLRLPVGDCLRQISLCKKHNIFDEFAKKNLKTTDTLFCLKLAYVLMVNAPLACVFADFNGIIAGIFCC